MAKNFVLMTERLRLAVNTALANGGHSGKGEENKSRRNRRSTLTEFGASGGGTSYRGAFTVIDTSKDDKPKVKVCDGTTPESSTCGIARINNKRFNIPAKEFDIDSAGFIILTSEYDTDGKTPKTPEMKFEKSLPADSDLKALILIARIGLIEKITPLITQEQHGMAQGFIWGNCEDDK